MTISEALSAFKENGAVVVGDKTFTPKHIDAIRLESGETVYWVFDGDGTWLSLDPHSEEAILFEDLNEELEPEDDTVVYGGEDYEFSYEDVAVGTTHDNDETRLTFREFESSGGDIIRLTENTETADVKVSQGSKLTEDDLQRA